MKILLSVFACSPAIGSEAGGGWNYAIRYFTDPVQHRTLCRAALLRVVSLTWEKKIQRVMTLIRVRLGR